MSEVEVDKMFRLMGYKASKVSPNNAMPRGSFPVVKRLLDILCDILFNAELRHCFLRNVNGFL